MSIFYIVATILVIIFCLMLYSSATPYKETILGEWCDKKGNLIANFNSESFTLRSIEQEFFYSMVSRSTIKIWQNDYPPENMYFAIRNGKLLLYFPITSEGIVLYRKETL